MRWYAGDQLDPAWERLGAALTDRSALPVTQLPTKAPRVEWNWVMAYPALFAAVTPLTRMRSVYSPTTPYPSKPRTERFLTATPSTLARAEPTMQMPAPRWP